MGGCAWFPAFISLASLAVGFGCGGSKGAPTVPPSSRSGTPSGSTGASGDATVTAPSSGTSGVGASGTSSFGSSGISSFAAGGPGCGLAAAAFCDTFDAPSTTQGRAGELNPLLWSAGRVAPQGPTGHGGVYPIGEAVIPACRAGITSPVFPDGDTLICDPTADVNSNFLLTAVASQNYGSNSYRIRQPFDFSGRTGTIVLDGTASPYGGLFGWVSVEITQDPIAVPSYAKYVNDEGGVIPQNALEVQFAGSCGGSGAQATGVGISEIDVFSNYVYSPISPATGPCPGYQAGKMNHFEIHVSQTSLEVDVSPFSPDGKRFGAPMPLYKGPISLPFSRGWVHITAHNHASLKYSFLGTFGVTSPVDATVTLWDNVGFDGPIVTNTREYEVPDALLPITGFQPVNDPADPNNPSGKAFSTGYLAPDVATGPATTLHLQGVDLTNAAAARLALTTWYLTSATNAQYDLKYRLNGGSWRDRPISAAEAALLTGPPGIQGALGQVIDVALSDLVAGDNTLEFVTSNVPQNYPPAIANVDLVIATP
jgi:hypothetical protein